jgi:hypothetical protein
MRLAKCSEVLYVHTIYVLNEVQSHSLEMFTHAKPTPTPTSNSPTTTFSSRYAYAVVTTRRDDDLAPYEVYELIKC